MRIVFCLDESHVQTWACERRIMHMRMAFVLMSVFASDTGSRDIPVVAIVCFCSGTQWSLASHSLMRWQLWRRGIFSFRNTSKDSRLLKARWRFLTCREAKDMHSVCRDAWAIYARADVFHARRWLLMQVDVVLAVVLLFKP